jgi:DNA-binding FadR family transcriptional regulator
MPSVDLDSDLLNYIVENGFNPGDRLPTINDLKSDAHLGISASKIREQLEVARALGLVDVRSKVGTHLKDYSFAPAVILSLKFALARDHSLFELFVQLRNHVVTAFWHEACTLLRDEDKQIMRDCVLAAREKLSGKRIQIPHEEHRTFHLTFFKRLENPFVTGLLEAYWDGYDTVRLNSYVDYDYLQSVWNYHESIIEAICAGDYDAAQKAFIEHTKLLRYQTHIGKMKRSDISTQFE